MGSNTYNHTGLAREVCPESSELLYALKIRELALAVAGEHDPANIKILQDVYDTLVQKLDKCFKCRMEPPTLESNEVRIRHTTLLVQAQRYVLVKLFKKMVKPHKMSPLSGMLRKY